MENLALRQSLQKSALCCTPKTGDSTTSTTIMSARTVHEALEHLRRTEAMESQVPAPSPVLWARGVKGLRRCGHCGRVRRLHSVDSLVNASTVAELDQRLPKVNAASRFSHRLQLQSAAFLHPFLVRNEPPLPRACTRKATLGPDLSVLPSDKQGLPSKSPATSTDEREPTAAFLVPSRNFSWSNAGAGAGTDATLRMRRSWTKRLC